MSEFESLDVSDDLFDMLVGAGFENPLPLSFFPKILEGIIENTRKANPKWFFEGLSKVELNQNNVRLQFRFSRRPTEIGSLSAEDRDDLPRNMTNFVIYIIAVIDSIHHLADVPFPPTFREVLKYPPFE